MAERFTLAIVDRIGDWKPQDWRAEPPDYELLWTEGEFEEEIDALNESCGFNTMAMQHGGTLWSLVQILGRTGGQTQAA